MVSWFCSGDQREGYTGAMKKRLDDLRRAFTPAAFAVLALYALYRLLAYSSYVTNFGLCADPLGYVSNIPFMMGAAVGNLVSCAIVFVLYASGRLRGCDLHLGSPLALIALIYLVVALVPNAVLAEVVASSFLGVLWGLTITVVGFGALELLTGTASPIVLIVQLAVSAFLFATGSLVLGLLPDAASALLCALLSLALIPGVSAGRVAAAVPRTAPDTASLATLRATLRECSTPILAVSFFELVTGLVNMYAFAGHSPFTIATQAPLEGSLICAVLLTAFVVITARIPHSRFMYLAVFPGSMAVFLALPYFGDTWGPSLSTVIYTAYTFTAMLSTFCVVRAARRAGDCIYGAAALLSAAMRLCLVVGLALGWWFGHLSEGDTFVHLSIVCVACVYVLGVVVLLWGYRNSRQKPVVEVVEVVVEKSAPTFEESVVDRVEALARAHGLSPRERDVLVGLAQGNTAASIAKGLCISTSTAQGYIKSLYAKLGVNKKQQVIDLFQK